jgi:maltose O-acetyltransferase
VKKHLNKFLKILQEETKRFHPGLGLAHLLDLPLPPFVMNRYRTQILRMVGFEIGSGTLFFDIPTIVGDRATLSQFRIGQGSTVGIQCYIDLVAPISIGNCVTLGPQTMLITGTHEVGPPEKHLGKVIPLPIHIGDGVWIAARVTILPGVTIGPGAIIGAGALVNRDVPANTVVAGVPAKPIRNISQPREGNIS